MSRLAQLIAALGVAAAGVLIAGLSLPPERALQRRFESLPDGPVPLRALLPEPADGVLLASPYADAHGACVTAGLLGCERVPEGWVDEGETRWLLLQADRVREVQSVSRRVADPVHAGPVRLRSDAVLRLRHDAGGRRLLEPQR